MQKTLKLQINKTKSKTNYIPSIPLNKIIELSEYPEKTWLYDRKTNQIHLITITKETETKNKETHKTLDIELSKSKKEKQKGKKLSRRERKKRN